MGEKIRFFELQTGEGQAILSFCLVEKELASKDIPKSPNNFGLEGRDGKETSGSGNNDSPMTEPQKRFLFRILADHGVQGEIAHQDLKNAFRVNQLTEVSKFEASKMIERLLGEGIGGLKNGPPIQ